jgi:hypothetical protein
MAIHKYPHLGSDEALRRQEKKPKNKLRLTNQSTKLAP